MALKKQITYKGIPLPNAYYRVTLPQIAASKRSMSFGLWPYADAAAAANAGYVLASAATSHEAPYDIAGDNPFAQAYAYLKTLPEFVDAVDC